jgi:anti-sigma factor (TIGR02949 family)
MTEPDKMRCEEVIEHLLDYLDGEINEVKRAQIDHHLEECRGCFSRAEFETALRKRIGQAGERQAPPTLEARIKALIDQF